MPALVSWWTQDVVALVPAADLGAVAETGADLVRRWAEPHRRYHSTRHLVEMFWALEDLTTADEVTDEEARLGRVAAWLHDAVYNPSAGAGANEAASAALADAMLRRLGLDERRVQVVVDLVLMTADHAVTSGAALDRAFHDADLWILTAAPDRFDAYCAQVRTEYAAVPDAVFRPARATILRDLWSSEGLYLTDYGRAHWESPARANLDRELGRLA